MRSNVSSWLGPPYRNRKITDRARPPEPAPDADPAGFGFEPAADARSANEVPNNPAPATCSSLRRGIPSQACAGQGDADDDGACDAEDNCLSLPNPDQLDVNVDGYGNACDADYTDDSAVGGPDFRIFLSAFTHEVGTPGVNPQTDHTGDGVVGGPDFTLVQQMLGSFPGPSGLTCAGQPPCP